MAKVGIFYGSDTGHTEDAAILIQQLFGEDTADLFDVAKVKDVSVVNNYDLVILGTSTWYLGELQTDMDNFRSSLADIDVSGRTFALFGLGNQVDYSDYFVDGIGILYTFLKEKGAKLIGRWPAEGYDFASQLPLTDDDTSFVGLALDEDNQPELTPDRAAEWVEQIRQEAGIQ
ncbi:flavodoxin I [Ruminobacter amylophilus]|uniref:Flavodoxin n=1 Tax=Ruminobacter amylophilus TaxID=867 RepID=A0A662ZJW7_9GAMM|nr:flavodoxin [Ruminobacter amylophilus]SFP72580.1 flavodoxin I [Ruminobacter amylophilus]